MKLTLEPNVIERVLRAADYSKVSSLSLMNFSKKHLFNISQVTIIISLKLINIEFCYLENPSRIQLMNEHITHLNVHIIDEIDNDNDELNLLEFILSLSKCLIDIAFHRSIQFQSLNFHRQFVPH